MLMLVQKLPPRQAAPLACKWTANVNWTEPFPKGLRATLEINRYGKRIRFYFFAPAQVWTVSEYSKRKNAFIKWCQFFICILWKPLHEPFRVPSWFDFKGLCSFDPVPPLNHAIGNQFNGDLWLFCSSHCILLGVFDRSEQFERVFFSSF